MGFLEVGKPFGWRESREVIEYVRTHGVAQFIAIYNKVKNIENDELLWGDELEYGIFIVDEAAGTVKLSLRSAEILATLTEREAKSEAETGCHWVPEYGSWMVEGTPARPYSGFANDLLRVESNMRNRRARLLAALRPGEVCPTLPCFPMLGVGDFTQPAAPPGGPFTESLFVPDLVINPHPRFGALTQNIRTRRGEKVDIRMPRFRDTKTPTGTGPGGPPPTSLQAALEMDEVYMDAMAFGMGCCCLQVTFQARDVQESRHLYDHLAVLSPIMLALTAATPVARGTLLDTDARWDIISASVDDRTPAERGGDCTACDEGEAEGEGIYSAQMAGGGRRPLRKSRYDSISSYICTHLATDQLECNQRLNDIDHPVDEAALQQLLDGGVDELLARHIAHLFVRDPLVVFHGRVELNDDEHVDHFENLQSTNWQTVRWKPPPASSKRLGGSADIGWRVEFRSMEIQLTDFENAAFTVFIVLVSRVILYFGLNLYVPISKVDENMKRAQRRDALHTQKFHFRQSITSAVPCSHRKMPSAKRQRLQQDAKKQFGQGCSSTEMSIREILMGNGKCYKGLVPMIMAYLHAVGADTRSLHTIESYMDFIVARASGELLTPAAWIRSFVRAHPDYKHDSVVSPRIAADLMTKCHRVGVGSEKAPELHGAFSIAPIRANDAYSAPLVSDPKVDDKETLLGDLVDHYTERTHLTLEKRKLESQIGELTTQLEQRRAELKRVNSKLDKLNERQTSAQSASPAPLNS